MSDESQLSMNEMPLHDHHQDWTDGHIAIRSVGFNPSNGMRIFRLRNSTSTSASITYGLSMGLTVDRLPVQLRNPLIPTTERIRNGWS
jgi:hypothetical protein